MSGQSTGSNGLSRARREVIQGHSSCIFNSALRGPSRMDHRDEGHANRMSTAHASLLVTVDGFIC